VLSGQNLISMIAELKQNAVVSNFALLNQNIAQQDAKHHKTSEALQAQLASLQHQMRQVCLCSRTISLGSTICPCNEFPIPLQRSLLWTYCNYFNNWATLARNRMMCVCRSLRERDSTKLNAMAFEHPRLLKPVAYIATHAHNAQNKAHIIKLKSTAILQSADDMSWTGRYGHEIWNLKGGSDLKHFVNHSAKK